MKWEKKKLCECTEYITDGDHQPAPKADKGVHFIKIKDIVNNQVSFDAQVYVPQEYYDNLPMERKPQKEDVLYTVVGSFGIPSYVQTDELFCFERNIALLHPNKDIEPRFLYYSLKNPAFYKGVEIVANGSAQKLIPLSKLKDLKISVPDKEAQRHIADILSAYDDLIENNQKQIKLLEEAAQRLYKEWFVDLHFPGHENTKIVDGVPEGWIKEEIGKIIKKVHRTKQIVASEYNDEGSIPIVDQSRAFVAGYTNDLEARVDFGIPIIVFGDHTRIVKLIQFPFAKGADGTQLIISDCLEMPQRLLYCSIMNVDLSNYHYARHFKYLKEEKILIPTVKVANEFENNVTGIFSKIQNCRDEIIRCQKTRDLLLPKLMSGEVEV